MKLVIHKDCDLRLPRRALCELARLIGRAEKKPARTAINLIVTNDRRLRNLNRDYRKLDKSTDVLSFTYPVLKSSDLLGEVYISAQRVRSQAREIGHSASAEALRLTCHGLLHILGYDHKTADQTRRMYQREKRYLKTLKRNSPRSPNTIV